MAPGKLRRQRRAARASARKARAKAGSSGGGLDVAGILGAAREAEARGDYVSAIEKFEKVVQVRKADAELCEELGMLYLQAGKGEEAEMVLRRAIGLKPEKGFEKYVNLSQLLGYSEEALGMVGRAIEVLRTEIGRIGDGERERWMELRGYEARAHCALAEIGLGIIEESNDPKVAERMDGEVENAVVAAMALGAGGGEVEIEVGVALANLRLSQGRKGEAAEAMKRVWNWMTEGLQLLEGGEGDKQVVEGLEKLPGMEVRIAVGKQLVEVGMWEEAIRVLGSVMWECDFNVEVWYLIAVAYWKLGDTDEARSALQSTRAVLRNPEGYEGELEDDMIDKLWQKLDEQDAAGKQLAKPDPMQE